MAENDLRGPDDCSGGAIGRTMTPEASHTNDSHGEKFDMTFTVAVKSYLRRFVWCIIVSFVFFATPSFGNECSLFHFKLLREETQINYNMISTRYATVQISEQEVSALTYLTQKNVGKYVDIFSEGSEIASLKILGVITTGTITLPETQIFDSDFYLKISGREIKLCVRSF